MSKCFIITGTDTDAGKTVFAAALLAGLHAAGHRASYWKPVQSGVEEVDTRTVQRLSDLPDEYFIPEKYLLTEPLSPHRAAEIDDIEIDLEALRPPQASGPLLIEGAGGLMVPLTRKNLQINQFKKWNAPVILCAHTGLGTINHTLLSLEALWARKIPLLGIAFIGDENADNMRTIAEFSGDKVLGRLPILKDLSSAGLLKAFQKNFRVEDFLSFQDVIPGTSNVIPGAVEGP